MLGEVLAKHEILDFFLSVFTSWFPYYIDREINFKGIAKLIGQMRFGFNRSS